MDTQTYIHVKKETEKCYSYIFCKPILTNVILCTDEMMTDVCVDVVGSVSVHGPGSLHPPHGERVAESFMGHVAARRRHVDLGVGLVAPQHLVQEVYVSGCEFEGLDLRQLV